MVRFEPTVNKPLPTEFHPNNEPVQKATLKKPHSYRYLTVSGV
jgi:hypothetical protein